LKNGLRDWRIWLITDRFGHRLRSTAIRIVKNVENGHHLDQTIDHYFSTGDFTDTQKALLHEITSGVIRWKGYLDWVLSQYIRKSMKRDVKYLLWITLYQLVFMRKAYYHVINEAVEFAKQESGPQVGNFVNAVLRQFLQAQGTAAGPGSPRPGEESEGSARSLAEIHSFPEWLVVRWLDRFGKDSTVRLMELLNQPPEFALRLDLRKCSQETAMNRLKDKGVSTRPGKYLASAIHVYKLGPVLKDELFKTGCIRVQDEMSQLAGLSVEPAQGSYILDACAGLGTKTEQIMEKAPALLVSMDRSVKRLELGPEEANRVIGDIIEVPFRKGSFDAILLDAPCSSLGIIRKHPEIKWHRREEDISSFGAYQLRLIKSLWEVLKKGGCLVYSVCSFEPEETLDVIEGLRKEKPFLLENAFPFLFNREYLLSLPHLTGTDGFFVARLRKL
jgi:16S rRNA (cytosine967-C5)-methyltransferase